MMFLIGMHHPHNAYRVPAAVAAPTTASVSADDANTHKARGLDPVGDVWRKKPRGGWAAYWAKRRQTDVNQT
jgi:hypothetical protein